MKNISGKFGLLLLIVLMILSGSLLFFEDQIGAMANLLNLNTVKKIDNTGKVLKLAFLFKPTDLNPFSADPATFTRLHDVYEGLVKLDDNLNVIPGLAISYGLLSEKEWEIRLRQGVKFHDGSDFDVDDVVYSFNQAKAAKGGVAEEFVASVESLIFCLNKAPTCQSLDSSVEELEKIDKYTFHLKTTAPDPLLLNKLAKLPIIPDKFVDYTSPVGTGPYKLVDSTDMSNLKYQRNDSYWGELPYFSQVEEKSIQGKNDRVSGLLSGDVDFLVNVPPDSVQEIKDNDFKVSLIPSLEVGFVMFNLKDPVFGKKEVRIAIAQGLNKESFLDLAYGYAKTLNQFVSNGVFGYNPDLQGFKYDQKAAEETLSKEVSSFEKLKVDFYYPETLKLLGQYFKEQLILIGIDVNLKSLSDSDLQQKLQAQELPFYYLGWRNESGDAISFLKSVLHSKAEDGYGIYNGMNYKNEKVDQLIRKSETNLNLKERLKDMQEVMKIVLEDDVIGVPLFETQSIFAYRPGLYFKPRVDSLVFPSTIAER